MAEEEETYKITDQESSKKKKKRKNRIRIDEAEEEAEAEAEEGSPMEVINPEEEDEESKKKKKKKKKRKRRQEEEEEEKDIVAPVDMKVEVINSHTEKIPPFVGYFPSGFNPQKNGDENGVEVKAFSKKDRPKRLQLVVSPKESKVNFVGASHSGEAEASQVCTYAVCVVDKVTHTLQIVPIASNKILRLEPEIGVSDSHHKEPPKELKKDDATVKKVDQVNLLTAHYGTKTAIRKVKKDANLNRKADAETQKAINDKVGEVQVNTEAAETSSGIPARNIPPHDSNADTPEGAYPLDQIILKGEWDYLLDILELVKRDAEITPASYPSFISNRIPKLQEIKDEEDKKKLACIFSYIAHLIKYKEQLAARHASTPARIPSALLVKFTALFGRSGHSSRPDEKTDLIVSYVLVLTLIADGYLTDPSDIATDLKMSKVILKLHYEALGCKPKVVNGVKCYTLPVPLNLPKLNKRGRRR